MSRFTILLAGAVDPTARLRSQIDGRRVVAADGGIAHARGLDLVPELWIGDFDSAVVADLRAFASVERKSLSPAKDLTDGEAAIEAAIGRGGTDLLLVGALRGARTDHAVTNLTLALSLRERGIAVRLADGAEEATPLTPATQRIDLAPGTPFSILAFGDLAGLDVVNARWPLRNATVAFGSTRTQSNEALGPIDVACRKGRAMLLAQVALASPFTASDPIA